MKLNQAISHHYVIHSMKAALSLCLIATVAIYYDYQDFWYAIFLGFMCIQPNLGQSIKMMIGRFLGTWLGIGIGLLVTLTYNYNWIYYSLFTIATACILYYTVKPDISWGGMLCFFSLLNSVCFGPSNPYGAAHFAYERGLEVSLAIIGTTLILTILQFDYAHKNSLDIMSSLLNQYRRLFLHIVDPYIHQAKPSRMFTIQRQLKACRIYIRYLCLQMEFARFEVKRKNFHPRHGKRLAYQFRRIQLIINSLRIMGEYYTVKDCDIGQHDREVLMQAKSYCATQFERINRLILNANPEHNVDYSHQAARRLQALLRLNIARLNRDKTPKLLNRIIWLSIMQRLVNVLHETEQIAFSFRADKFIPAKPTIAEEFEGLATDKKSTLFPLSSERIRYGIHGAFAALFILMLQRYFQWDPLIANVGGIVIGLASISNYNETLSNIGMGIVGGIAGTAFSWLALSLLNYVPQYGLVMLSLFIGTAFASYFFTTSQLQQKKLMLFGVFFGLTVVLSLMAAPQQRGNLDSTLLVPIGLFLGTVLIAFSSRFIWRFDYIHAYRQRLCNALSHSRHVLEDFQNKNHDKAHMADDILQMYHSLDNADHAMQQAHWQRILNPRRSSRGTHSLDYIESIATSLLMMHYYYFRANEHSALVNEYIGQCHSVFERLMTNNQLFCGILMCDITEEPDFHIDDMRVQHETLIQQFIDSPQWKASAIIDIQTVAVLHNGILRLINIQSELKQTLKNRAHDTIYALNN